MSEPLTILGWPHAPDGSGYYRFYLPFEFLAHYSHHRVAIPTPEMLPYEPNDEDIDEVDVLIGQRWMFPRGIKLLEQWRDRTKLVYEVDDDILNPDTASGLAHLFEERTHESIIKCLGLAHMVTVSTEPLKDALDPYNDNVRVVPNQIHGDVLYIDRPRNEHLTVGWAGGMSHLQDWVVAAESVGNVLRDRDCNMHFMGIDYSPMLKIARTTYTPWTPHVWTYWTNIDFDIGLAPLADTQFNRCKSAIRALEYMALGIPVIASDCPAYREMVVDGVTGYLVKSEEEWEARLTDLLEDEAMRDEMGKNGREAAAQHIVQRNWKNWSRCYEEVTGWQA